MNLAHRHLINILEEHGFLYKRSKGSHQLYYNPINNKHVIVPAHGSKDMKKGTFLAFLKKLEFDTFMSFKI